MLVMMAGLPGTGKSTVARAVAERVGGAVIDKDVIRAALFAPEDIEYSAVQDDFVMELMLQTAAYLLRKNPSRIVFLDGRTFSHIYQRRRVAQFAESAGVPWRAIECVCSQETAHRRLADDASSGRHPAANRNWELYQRVRASFEPLEQPKIVVNTDASLSQCVQYVLEGFGLGT
jgi:adenylylsulfate kinase